MKQQASELLILDKIKLIFKTDKDALNFFLKNTNTIVICRICKQQHVIKEVRKIRTCCNLQFSYFQNTHTFFKKSAMKFRRNLALLYFLIYINEYYRQFKIDFQKKFTDRIVTKFVVYSEHSRFLRSTKKRFSVISSRNLRKYIGLFNKLINLLKNY